MMQKEKLLIEAIELAVKDYVFPNGDKIDSVENITIIKYNPDTLDKSMLERCTGGVFSCRLRVISILEGGAISEIRDYNYCDFIIGGYDCEKFTVNKIVIL